MSLYGDMIAHAHFDSQVHKKNVFCSICANCQTRNRWTAMYDKYLKETGPRADLKWVNQMIKTDKQMLPCLKGMI